MENAMSQEEKVTGGQQGKCLIGEAKNYKN